MFYHHFSSPLEIILRHQIADLESQAQPHCPGVGLSEGLELRKLKKERDALKTAVRNFETELLDIQMDTKILAEDRDNFKLLYEQVL